MSKKRRHGDINCTEVSSSGGKRQAIKIWSKLEETSIAEYISEHPYLGKNEAKETLVQYLRKMVNQLKLVNCDDQRIGNKYAAMKKKYEEVHKWINETGQGVRDEDPGTFPEKVMEKCHYYYTLDSVFGTSQAINTSYQRDSGDVFIVESVDAENQDFGNIDDYHNVNSDGQSSCVFNPDVNQEEQKLVGSASGSTNLKFEAALRTKPAVNSKSHSASSRIADYLERRDDLRSQIEQEKLEFEKLKWKEQQNQHSLEREKGMELELRKIELAHQVEMRKLEIEREIQLKKLELERTNT